MIDDKLKKYLDQIRTVISEADISFTKNPVDVLKQVVSNPRNVRSFEKEFKKFESPENFLKIASMAIPKVRSSNFSSMLDYIRTVLKNSIDLNDLESNFLAISICLRNIENLKNKLDIQRSIAKLVVKYRQKPKALLHLEPIVEGAKDLPESIRNLISVALIQYIRARVLK